MLSDNIHQAAREHPIVIANLSIVGIAMFISLANFKISQATSLWQHTPVIVLLIIAAVSDKIHYG
jgi:uncharacterized protein (DUF983 family)